MEKCVWVFEGLFRHNVGCPQDRKMGKHFTANVVPGKIACASMLMTF